MCIRDSRGRVGLAAVACGLGQHQADAAELGCRRISAGGKNLQIRRHPRRVCQIQLLPGEDARRLIRQGVVNLKIPVLLGGCQRSAGNQRIGQPHIRQHTLSHNPLGKPQRLRLAADGKLRLRAPGPCRYRPDPRAVHGTGPATGGIRSCQPGVAAHRRAGQARRIGNLKGCRKEGNLRFVIRSDLHGLAGCVRAVGDGDGPDTAFQAPENRPAVRSRFCFCFVALGNGNRRPRRGTHRQNRSDAASATKTVQWNHRIHARNLLIFGSEFSLIP